MNESLTLDEIYEMSKSDSWNWWLITENVYAKNLRKIHPLKQRQVELLCKEARRLCSRLLNKIIIFGSSTSYLCNSCSDLDICFDWKEDPFDESGLYFREEVLSLFKILKDITKDCNGYDMVFWSEVKDSRLGNIINRKGVIVYEQYVQEK